AGLQAGMISTIGAKIGDDDLDTGLHVTTPDAPDVQRYLAQKRDAGCEIAVLETTSHGLHQGRVAAVDFDVAVVTNVTHEHLDYHGSWDAYLDAKAILFRSLAGSTGKLRPDGSPQPKTTVLNADDASYQRLASVAADWQLSYSIETATADLYASQIEYGADHTTFVAATPGGTAEVVLPLAGPFNVCNCLAAIGAGLAVGLPLEQVVAAVATMPGVDGRMERIDCGQDFTAIVDFAHTPVSLQRALEAVRPMTAGRVIAVFGSAGLRDVQKRYLMAEISVRLADLSVLTAEDPRTESLDMILAQMAEGARRAGGVEERDFVRIPDRVEAIQAAMNLARPGDVVIVCGKGHEQSMCFGAVEHPWRDQPVVRWAVARRLGLSSAPAPFVLPTSTWPGLGT
ncbi:MAG: UDP-N-acetylmuramoyl-L-alanyl-D-glutamate--2,6-diaminopimelate ligase, partial [Anaerolineae bacterium]|nr:UDP-N-acetylmuramoyl-L-alanyl-D-glutamate--2,6-diaminopimelate ligase [Anaerolineae bacterium]